MNYNQQAFIALVKAGLWEREASLLPFSPINYPSILTLAEIHGVVGLVTAGMDQVDDVKIPQEVLLQFIGASLQLEQHNNAMSHFTNDLINKMRAAGVYGLLVKGQSLAQCYERPLWRASGDIDLFFSRKDFKKAVSFFEPLAVEKVQDANYTKSVGLMMDSWFVELHGTLRSGLSTRVDRVIDAVQDDTFYNGSVRAWRNGNTDVFIPGVDNDLFLLFTHFIRHFYQGEFVLRQVCDWCRFLWTFRGKIRIDLLKTRLERAGLMVEWCAFSAFIVNYLGMPIEAVPLYEVNAKWNCKAERILNSLFKERCHNKVSNAVGVGQIFPVNTIKFLPALLFNVNGQKIKERLLGNARGY